jgi:hypothetical protein
LGRARARPASWRGKEDLIEKRLTRISAAVGLLLAISATVWLAFWPCFYEGVEARAIQPAEDAAGGVGERHFCASLVEVNGVDVFWVLALAVGLAAIGAAAAFLRRRAILLVSTVALGVFCLLAGFSVGLYYLPAAAALLVAILAWRRDEGAAIER